jgi:hypothetical protein
MVETPYALTKYLAAIEKVFPQDERDEIGFLFNVETRLTFDHLDEMGDIASRQNVGMVFGRVDFAGSLGKDRKFVNSPEMTSYVQRAAEVSKQLNIDLVVGGGVSVDSIAPLAEVRKTKLSRFETRKVIFDSAILTTDKIEQALSLAIEFELLWLKNKRDYYLSIGAEDEKRIAMMEARQPAPVSVAA